MSSKEQQAAGRDFKRNSNAYASLPPSGSGAASSGAGLGTGTGGKARRGQQHLEQEQFGLSNSLSSESIRQACDYYDDELSDDDLIEIQQTPQSFHQQAKQPLQLQPISFRLGDGLGDERSAFCGSQEMQQAPLSTPIKQAAETDEALCVLSELDAILDVHDVSQLNGTCSSSSMNSGSDDDKVENYLMDLDNYLEEMDNALCREESLIIMGGHSSLKREPRTRTLPLSRKKKSNKKKSEEQEPGQGDFEREHQMRKTFSCSLRPTSQTGWNSL